MVGLGVPARAIVLETESRTTRENAKKTAEKIKVRAIILVTSASHIPRATRNYEAEGFAVLPYPTDFQSGLEDKPLYRLILPSAEALEQNQAIFKEWLAKWIGY